MRLLLNVLSLLFKLIGTLMKRWLILLIVAGYFTGIGPAVRMEYSYTPVYGGERLYHICHYRSFTGRFTLNTPQVCPFITIVNAAGERML